MDKTELEQASREFFEIVTQFLSREAPKVNLLFDFKDGMAIQLVALTTVTYKAAVGLVGAEAFKAGQRSPPELDRDPAVVQLAAQAMSAVLADVLRSHDPSANYEVVVRRIQQGGTT